MIARHESAIWRPHGWQTWPTIPGRTPANYRSHVKGNILQTLVSDQLAAQGAALRGQLLPGGMNPWLVRPDDSESGVLVRWRLDLV